MGMMQLTDTDEVRGKRYEVRGGSFEIWVRMIPRWLILFDRELYSPVQHSALFGVVVGYGL